MLCQCYTLTTLLTWIYLICYIRDLNLFRICIVTLSQYGLICYLISYLVINPEYICYIYPDIYHVGGVGEWQIKLPNKLTTSILGGKGGVYQHTQSLGHPDLDPVFLGHPDLDPVKNQIWARSLVHKQTAVNFFLTI